MRRQTSEPVTGAHAWIQWEDHSLLQTGTTQDNTATTNPFLPTAQLPVPSAGNYSWTDSISCQLSPLNSEGHDYVVPHEHTLNSIFSITLLQTKICSMWPFLTL